VKIFVTGANGFIGSNLCKYFLGRGCVVYGLVRKTSDLHFLRGLDVKLVVGDLIDPASIQIPRDVEYVVHAAATVSDTADEETCRKNIYLGAVNLAERIQTLGLPLKRLVYISTALTLGYNGLDISEEKPGTSAGFVAYARHKTSAEQFFLKRWEQDRLPVVILRPADVYGPNDRTSCGPILRGIERGVPVIVGNGNWRFGYCYIENLCQATFLALTRPGIEGKAYTVTNSELPTWKEFFSELQKRLRKKQRVYVPVWLAFAAAGLASGIKKVVRRYTPSVTYYRIRRITSDTTYDISKTIEELGYEPDNRFDRHMEAIVAWYLKEREDGFIK
jgi:dihydroflavonol-4-reductase